MHGIEDLTGIAIVAVAATLCGMAMVKLKQPPIIGYILTGVLLGPSGLSAVENRESIQLLAELGVILLLFFIGMELSLRSFRTIWRIALITTLVQVAVSVGVVYALAQQFDWPLPWTVLFGFCLALSSTAVAMKVLEDVGELRNRVGRIAIGILIAQDLAVAPMLVIVSGLSGGEIHPFVFIEVLLSVVILAGLILFLTRRRKVNLPFHRLISGKADLTPMAALAWCFGLAAVAGLIGLSPAFGAFLAGLVAGNSAQRQEVHEHAGPVQAVLLMVFFLSIGLLIDLAFLWENIWLILGLWLFVTVFKTALNTAVLRLQRESWANAFSVALVIGQLGEFSFVLGAAALSTAAIENEVHRFIVALTVLSLMTSPIYFDLMRRLRHRATRHISSFGGLLRFAYFREWSITKRVSRTAYDVAFQVCGWFGLKVGEMARKGTAAVMESNLLPGRKAAPDTPPPEPAEDAAMGDGAGERKSTDNA